DGVVRARGQVVQRDAPHHEVPELLGCIGGEHAGHQVSQLGSARLTALAHAPSGSHATQGDASAGASLREILHAPCPSGTWKPCAGSSSSCSEAGGSTP